MARNTRHELQSAFRPLSDLGHSHVPVPDMLFGMEQRLALFGTVRFDVAVKLFALFHFSFSVSNWPAGAAEADCRRLDRQINDGVGGLRVMPDTQPQMARPDARNGAAGRAPRFLVALPSPRDLLLRAKHLSVAARVCLGCGVTWLNQGGANWP